MIYYPPMKNLFVNLLSCIDVVPVAQLSALPLSAALPTRHLQASSGPGKVPVQASLLGVTLRSGTIWLQKRSPRTGVFIRPLQESLPGRCWLGKCRMGRAAEKGKADTHRPREQHRAA